MRDLFEYVRAGISPGVGKCWTVGRAGCYGSRPGGRGFGERLQEWIQLRAGRRVAGRERKLADVHDQCKSGIVVEREPLLLFGPERRDHVVDDRAGDEQRYAAAIRMSQCWNVAKT